MASLSTHAWVTSNDGLDVGYNSTFTISHAQMTLTILYVTGFGLKEVNIIL